MGVSAILHLRLPGNANEAGLTSVEKRASLVEFCQSTTPYWDIKPEGVYLDLTGTGRLFGWGADGPARVCRLAGEVLGALAGGAGPTLLAARLASMLTLRLGEPGLFMVPPGSVQGFLASFPIGVLENYPSQVRRLRELGVRTLGDLQLVPPSLLKAVFGKVADTLVSEAAGSAPNCFSHVTQARLQAELLVGARLDRPLTSAAGQTALLDGLAFRAMATFPEGPVSCPSWQLRSGNSKNSKWCATLSSNETGTLSAWRGLLRNLLERLSHNRLGITYLELWCCRGPGVGARQGYLFPADDKSRQLGAVLGQMNGPGKPGVGTASEQLLSRWGICWYGPICPEKSDS